MRGYIVDSNDKPVTFRIKDPTTKQVETGFMLVRGGAVSVIPATPGQITPESVQYEPTPDRAPRIGALGPELLAAAALAAEAQAGIPVENGVVVPDQSPPQPHVPPVAHVAPTAPVFADPATAAEPDQGEVEERSAALSRGPASEL